MLFCCCSCAAVLFLRVLVDGVIEDETLEADK